MSNVMNSDAQAPQGVIVAYIPGASLLDLASIKAELDRIKEGRGPGPMIVQERVPVGAPAEVLEEPVANVVGKIQKMSALLWKAFEERMRIR